MHYNRNFKDINCEPRTGSYTGLSYLYSQPSYLTTSTWACSAAKRELEHRDSNPGLFGYKPKALPLIYVPLCVSISRVPAFKALTQCITYDYFYFRRASASYLLVGRYPTTWRREELNLHCLPHGNWFTVSRRTTNICIFPGIAYTLRHSRWYAGTCQPLRDCRTDFIVLSDIYWEEYHMRAACNSDNRDYRMIFTKPTGEFWLPLLSAHASG